MAELDTIKETTRKAMYPSKIRGGAYMTQIAVWNYKLRTNLRGILILGLIVSATGWMQAQQKTDWKPVETAMGRPGTMMGDVIRFGMPRKDLHVMVAGTAVKPGLALGSWAAFRSTEKGAMVMGDLVLTEDEVQPVMKKLQDGGIAISALHNHLLGEQPRVLYMHIGSQGEAAKMAETIHEALALTKTPAPDAGGGSDELMGLDQKKIEEVLARTGKANGGILSFGVPRAETIIEHAVVIPPAIGSGDLDQLSANRKWEGGDCGGFCSVANRGESGDEDAAGAWDRGDSSAQPHADGGTAPDFHAFLGER